MRNITLNRRLQSSAAKKSSIPNYRNVVQIILALALVLFGASVCFAQTQFAVAVGGTSDDEGMSLIQTTDSGFAVAGCTESFGAGWFDFFLVKFSLSGAVEWSRAIGRTDDDEGSSVIQTTDGGFAMTGVTENFGAATYDLFLVKFSSAGAVEWSRAVGGTNSDYGWSVIQTTDGGFAVAGETHSFGSGSGDLFLVKFSSSGVVEWSRTVGGTDGDDGWSVIQTSDGGFAVAGNTANFGAGGVFLVKFSSAGAVEWSRTVGGMDDEGYSVIQTTDGGFAVAGETWSFGAGGSDLFLVKFSSAGAVEWSKAVGGTSLDYGYSVIQTTDSGFAVVGWTESFGAGGQDLFLVKFSLSGAVEWSSAVGGTNSDVGWSVIQASDGGFAVAGNTANFGAGARDLFLVKFDSEGNSCIGEFVSPTVTDVSPAVDTTFPDTTSPSPTITDISPTVTNVSQTVTEICTDLDIVETLIKPQRFEISVNPNPFNSSVKITISDGRGLACQTLTNIAIYDLRGKLVVGATRWVAQQQGDATHRPYIWTPDQSIASGIYFVRAKTENGQTATKRLVYLK